MGSFEMFSSFSLYMATPVIEDKGHVNRRKVFQSFQKLEIESKYHSFGLEVPHITIYPGVSEDRCGIV